MRTVPSNLRPATAEDIKVGARIWYQQTDAEGGPFCVVVEEVLRPDDLGNAFSSHSGNRFEKRYGLDGAMVEMGAEADASKSAVKDLIRARAKMETEIRTAVQRIVADFEAETGLTPSSIYIQMKELQEFGRNRSTYVITNVETSVCI